jgi:polyketide biosynthesis 3-hydroxy-3-methylglutaryl-CoA synthase-like enzyme PksG
VTLAVNAAAPLVEEYGKSAFELLIVASESSFDYGKSMGTYAHRYLGLDERCRTFEVKQACYGATAALRMAAAWVQQTQGRALVIATDIGRKGVPMRGEVLDAESRLLAEASSGAGAVAMVVSQQPRVMALGQLAGFVTREIFDVCRPAPQMDYADPRLSVSAYLDLLESAFAQFRAQGGPKLGNGVDYAVYHTPVPALVRQAHRSLLSFDFDDSPSEEEMASSFERCVAPSLKYARETGNCYSGTVYVSLASLIDAAPDDPSNANVAVYSYGSGSVAEYFLGTFAAGARDRQSCRNHAHYLETRERVSAADYVEVVAATSEIEVAQHWNWDQPICQKWQSLYAGKKKLILDNISHYYRKYRWS